MSFGESASARLDSLGLGAWVGLPVAGFLALLVAIFTLPGSDCEGGPDGSQIAPVLVAVVVSVVSICCIAAGAYRVGTLLSGRSKTSSLEAAVAIAILVGAHLVVSPGDERQVEDIAEYMVVGALVTAVALACLTVALLARRPADRLGLLLPVYLFGAGLCVYPIFAWVALGASAGAFC